MKNLFKIIFLSICSSLAFTFSLTLQGQTTAELQAEIDAIEVGAGLEADGTYEADPESNYISGAESFKDADSLLDDALKAESDASNDRDDAIEAGAGLDENGNYIANAESNYLTKAKSMEVTPSWLVRKIIKSYITQPQPLNHKELLNHKEIKKIEDSKHISQL
ncbi:MAG: hypothetical protein ACJZ9B_03810 [Coraliomargaritaceae bacterium]